MGVLDRLLRRTNQISTEPGEPAFAVIDVETTGLSPCGDRIVQIAVVRVDDTGREVDRWATLLDPERPVGASDVHGITDADVVGRPLFRDVAATVVGLVGGLPIVAHNAAFDVAFLRAELVAAGWDVPALAEYCTLQASRTYLPRLARRRLADCCAAIGYPVFGAHSALADALAAAALLAMILRCAEGADAEIARVCDDARATVWSSGPARSARLATPVDRRDAWRTAPPRTEPPALLPQITALRLADIVDEGAPPGALPYLELLLTAVADGVLTACEADALADLQASYRLTDGEVAAAHRGMLLAVAHRAVDDGHVQQAERTELAALATLLGVPEREITGLIRRAEHERMARLSLGLVALPSAWAHGEPLRVGDHVVFTGCDEADRRRLEQLAEQRGIRVGSAVSRRTAVLVTDGSFSGAKLASAREHGTRIVDPTLFDLMLAYLQPAIVLTEVVRESASRPAASRPSAPRGGRPQVALAH